MRRTPLIVVAAVTAATMLAAPLAGASSAKTFRGVATFPTTLNASAPLVTVTFRHAVSATEMPPLRTSPALEVTWTQVTADSVAAVTTSSLQPDGSYLLNVPTKISCATVCAPVGHTRQVVTAASSITWLDELLARLNYLPVTFVPTTPLASGDATTFVHGSFTWKFDTLPKVIQDLWSPGTTNLVLRGAIMRFQSVHNLATTGVADATTWSVLLKAVASHEIDPTPYDYVYVNTNEPESLHLYRNGHLIFVSLVNTGVAAAPTAPGTYPVYARYISTTMSGVEPDGKPYLDKGIPWVSYFHGGDALHGFIRSSYGWPQSLGCVEMPYANAHRVFPWTPIGTLVTIS